jgi:hypothetical protein
MTWGSSQASSMISRMRETGMELAIDEGSATSLPILVSWERNGSSFFSHLYHPRLTPDENKGSGKPELRVHRAW